MSTAKRVAFAALACALFTACATAAPEPGYVGRVAQADRAGTTFPRVHMVLADIDAPRAYVLQGELIRWRLREGSRIAGFKGGLMSAKSLADRGAKEPVIGVLFAEGRQTDGSEVSLCGYRRPALEAKIGFMFGAHVREPIADVAGLQSKISAAVPVVELPDIAYDDDQSYNAIDMIAANVSSAKYVMGTAFQPPTAGLDDLEVTVELDGEPATQGLARESLDGQWASLLRLVNLAVGQGRSIEPGELFLTGKIGAKLNVVEGAYQADYGPMGLVRFITRRCAAGGKR